MSSPRYPFSRERTADSPWPDSRNAVPARVPKMPKVKADRNRPLKKRKMTEFAELAYYEGITRDFYTSMETERASRPQKNLNKFEQARALLAEEVDALETVWQAAMAKGLREIWLPDAGFIKQYRAALPSLSDRKLLAVTPAEEDSDAEMVELTARPTQAAKVKSPIGIRVPDAGLVKQYRVTPAYVDASVNVNLANEDLEAEMTDLKQSLRRNDLFIDKQKAEIESLKDKVKDLNVQVANLTLEKENNDQRYQQSVADKDAQLNANIGLKKNMEDMKTNLANLRVENEDHRLRHSDIVADRDRELDAKHSEVDSLKGVIEGLKTDVANLTREKQQNEASIRQMDETVDSQASEDIPAWQAEIPIAPIREAGIGPAPIPREIWHRLRSQMNSWDRTFKRGSWAEGPKRGSGMCAARFATHTGTPRPHTGSACDYCIKHRLVCVTLGKGTSTVKICPVKYSGDKDGHGGFGPGDPEYWIRSDAT